MTRPHTCTYEHCRRHPPNECLFAKLAAKNQDRVLTKPGRYVPDRFRSIATVSITAAVTTRHPQCPVVTPVGTEGTNTVAVMAKADGRRTPSAVLTPQRPLATGATRSKHQLQHVGSEETKYDGGFFKSLATLSIGCTWCFLLLDSIPIHKRPHIRRS